MIDLIMSDPLYFGATAIGIGVVGGGLIAKQYLKNNEMDIIETEGMHEKLKSIFITPTESQGSVINDYIKMRGVANTPTLIGLAIRGKKNNVETVTYDEEEKQYVTSGSKGYTYTVVEGNKKYVLKLKKFLTEDLGVNYFKETYDVPKNLIVASDNYIWFNPEAHFVKFNGVKRHFSIEGLSRGWEASFSKTHENYLESKGDIPEQYSYLNNRLAGQLKQENLKSENIKNYMKDKNISNKDQAMKD